MFCQKHAREIHESKKPQFSHKVVAIEIENKWTNFKSMKAKESHFLHKVVAAAANFTIRPEDAEGESV